MSTCTIKSLREVYYGTVLVCTHVVVHVQKYVKLSIIIFLTNHKQDVYG